MTSPRSDAKTINDLIAKLNDSEGSVREEARSALVEMGTVSIPSLIKALESKQEQVRWEAAKALISLPDNDAVPALVKTLQDKVFDIRWLAAEALIAIGKGSIEPLLQALIEHSKDSFLRQGAHHVITYVIPREPNPEVLADILKPVENALDGLAPRATVAIAAKTALDRMRHSI
jgi:HEAT repeat protein